ncbi:MAG: serine protease [Chloroflexi bacterium]|nr:serine protease [Chloroflexota bacterium]
MQIDLWLVILIVIGAVAFTVISVILGIRAHRQKVTIGKDELVGKTGEVELALSPKGIVLIQGERWAAISQSGRIDPGEEVIITKVEGLKLYAVKKNKEVNE